MFVVATPIVRFINDGILFTASGEMKEEGNAS
jgi:hypothetical protein